MKPILIKDLGYLYATETSKNKVRFGIFKCHCGSEFKVIINSIKTGNTKSCGCINKKSLHKITHGLINHRLYIIFHNIKSRCYNKNNKRYKDYGGRGILMCDEWLNDFKIFYDWALQNGYHKDLTIDRENNDKGYNHNNCRWTTKSTQSQNTRKLIITNTSGYRGVSWHKHSRKWSCKITVNNKRIYLGTFKCRLAAAYSYDNYVRENNLEHTLNFDS